MSYHILEIAVEQKTERRGYACFATLQNYSIFQIVDGTFLNMATFLQT